MAQFPAINVWTDSWLADTAHLPRVDRDIYFHLLILMWRTPGCRVPNEIDWIARKLRCTPDEVPILQSIVSEFCQTDGNWLTQKRLLKEFKLAAERSRAASDKAKSRWNKEKSRCSGNASTTTTIITEESPLPPIGGGGSERSPSRERRKSGYSIRESLAQAEQYIDAREHRRSEESGEDDPFVLPRLRQGSA